MMGGKLQPSVPSLGVCVAQPAESGKIELFEHRPSPWRFFTLQTEEMDMVEFAPVEQVHLRPARILNLSKVVDGELFRLGKPKKQTGFRRWRRGSPT